MTDPLEMAAAYFVVNRCSFSGATFCGGFSAEAAEKRCNPSAIERLQSPAFQTISNLDGIQFLRDHPETQSTVIYADPPYYISTYVYGKDGDMHERFDHEEFAKYIQTRKDWVLSYNDCPYIRNLYAGCRIYNEKWAYGMNASKPSTEIVILPPL
jgi:DNA adenine methylase